MGRLIELLKLLLIGRPKPTSQLKHERLSKKVGLAVFASDNLSSAAYATEEMLVILVAGGALALNYSVPVAVVLVAVVAIIAFSYRETIQAYPNGGGAYIVAHENLGRFPGLVAGAALLIDYTLTVAVSVSAGVAAIVSFAPFLFDDRVTLALGVIAFITIVNLRGVRESGKVFAVPTYGFLILVGGTILVGITKYYFFGLEPVTTELPVPTQEVTIFFLMAAFARGSAAVTGIEAISNGIPAFREPAAKNAAKTLVVMASLLAFLFLGITVLARLLHIAEPEERRTVVGQIAAAVWGEGVIFVAVLGATAAILFLAANTSYADFPRLSSVIARDRYWPRQFMNRGDRLTFSNGIIGLALQASALVLVFEANVTSLINLYVIGVFTALTLSQSGMVVHWLRLKRREPRWRQYAVVNGVGATVTLTVLAIVLATRFTHGGWIVVVAIPVLVLLMNRIHTHYMDVGDQLRDPARRPLYDRQANHVVLLVGGPSREEARAFWYADRIRTDDFHAVHFKEKKDPKGLEASWARQIGLLPTSPVLETAPLKNSLIGSVRDHISAMRNRISREDFITVIVSERVEHGRFITLGTRQALRLKVALLYTPDVVVTNVPYLENLPQTALELGTEARHVVIVLVAAAHNATLHALEYAKTLSSDEVHAVHVVLDPEMAPHHVEAWRELVPGHPLELIDSPHRRLAAPLRDYIHRFTDGHTIVTVVVPEFVVKERWARLLHNQNAFDVKWTLLAEPDVIVTSVPYHLRVRPRKARADLAPPAAP